jgi:hypothetical protein
MGKPNTDKINLDELLDNIDNQDIIFILDHDISEEEGFYPRAEYQV